MKIKPNKQILTTQGFCFNLKQNVNFISDLETSYVSDTLMGLGGQTRHSSTACQPHNVVSLIIIYNIISYGYTENV